MPQAHEETLTGSLDSLLAHDHRDIDDGIRVGLDGADGADLDGLTVALGALRRHIYAEEELLFPPLRDAGLVGPILVMVREHAQMWQLLDSLEGLLGADTVDPDALRATRAELFELLQRHNPKEETILYPQADAVLTPSRASQVRAFIASEEPPEGWVCQGLRR